MQMTEQVLFETERLIGFVAQNAPGHRHHLFRLLAQVKNGPSFKSQLHPLANQLFINDALDSAVKDLIQANVAESPTQRTLLIADKSNAMRIIGMATLAFSANASPAIGFAIDENNRRKGFGTETCMALLDVCFSNNYQYVHATVDPSNHASRETLRKSGMHECGETAEGLIVFDTSFEEWETYLQVIQHQIPHPALTVT